MTLPLTPHSQGGDVYRETIEARRHSIGWSSHVVKSSKTSRGLVAHTLNLQHWGGRGRRSSEFEARLVYKSNYGTVRATQREKEKSSKRGLDFRRYLKVR